MSWLSDALAPVQKLVPNSGGNAINPFIGLGIGPPVVNMNRPDNPFQTFGDVSRGLQESPAFSNPSKYLNEKLGTNINLNPTQGNWSFGSDPNQKTEKERAQYQQVKDKIDAGLMAEGGDSEAHIKYLRSLYDRQMKGFDPNPEAYKGRPTGEAARAAGETIATRNSTQVANQNARLGKMGAGKGADSLRMALENSLTNEQMLGENEARASADEYNSKIEEMQKAYGLRQQAGIGAVNRQQQRFEDIQGGWQGELGRLGKSIVEGAGLGGAVTYGAGKLNQGLGQNNQYFRNTFGNVPVDAANLMLDPNESARQLKGLWNRQAGKDNPFIQDASQYGLDPFRRK